MLCENKHGFVFAKQIYSWISINLATFLIKSCCFSLKTNFKCKNEINETKKNNTAYISGSGV